MSEKPIVGFIGAGNMAGALIKGLIESGTYQSRQLAASDKDPEKQKGIERQFGLVAYSSNPQLVCECSIIVLSIKPQQIGDVLEEIKSDIRKDHLIISVAAGIPLSKIQTVIDKKIPMIRVMPNTPALVQKGMSALAGNESAAGGSMATAKAIFDAVGETVEVKEDMMDAVTALSGSGPGYIFRIMECMVRAGEAVGLTKDVATRLVIQTFLGASHLAKTSDQTLSRLREMVTSPGGTTAQGLATFDKMGLEDMTQKAVQAAFERSIALGKSES